MQGYQEVYRLIYQIKENELLIFVMKAGNRGDIYKAL